MTKKYEGEQRLIFEEIFLREPPPLRIEHARVPTSAVMFDDDNPRLRYQRTVRPNVSETDLLIDNTDGRWLKKDIKEKGLLDSIYVRRVDNEDGTTSYICVEGNRRTACVRELNAEFPEDPRFQTIPARILPEKTTEEQTALLMASFHVAGKVKWDAHEKAGHIYHMLRKLRIPEAEMSTTLHMGVAAIKRAAESYAILEEVYKRIDGGKYSNDAAGKWSFFDCMLSIKEFKAQHQKSDEWSATFSRWVGEKRIPRAEDVRALPAILNKSQSRRLFENEPVETAFRDAKRISDMTDPATQSKFFKKLEEVIDSCKTAPFGDVEFAGSNDAARVMLVESYRAITSFMEKAGVRVPPPARAA
jgi:hypothetical protein